VRMLRHMPKAYGASRCPSSVSAKTGPSGDGRSSSSPSATSAIRSSSSSASSGAGAIASKRLGGDSGRRERSGGEPAGRDGCRRGAEWGRMAARRGIGRLLPTGRTEEHLARVGRKSHHGAPMVVRPAEPRDTEAVAAIYNHGIAERQATFETRPRRANEILGWLEEGRPFIVAAGEEGTILGFARVSAYSTRRAYAGVGEHAVYVAPAARGRGVGVK